MSLKSTYFEQKIPMTFYLAKPGAIDSPAATTTTSASASTTNNNKTTQRSQSHAQKQLQQQLDLTTQQQQQQQQQQLSEQSVHFSRQIESLQVSNQSLSQSLKDQQQENEHLRNMLENVNNTVPNVTALVDEQIKRERADFEERSAKVLNILRKKDQTIQQLESRLEQEFELTQSLRVAEDEQTKKLQREIERLQNRVIEQSEQMRKKDVDALELIQSSAAHTSHLQTDSFMANVRVADDEIVRELKNKIASQSEHIEVLMAEVQSLRKTDSSTSQGKNEQIMQLTNNLASAKEELKAKDLANASLKRALEDAQSMISSHRHRSNYREDEDNDDDSLSPPPPPTTANSNDAYEKTVFEQTSKICDLEIQCSNNLAAIASKDSTIRQLTHKLTELEATSNSLTMNSQSTNKELIETRKKLQQLEAATITHDDKVASLTAQLTTLEDINSTAKNTVIITEARLQEALQQLESLQQNRNRQRSGHRAGSVESGANAWWLHIANDAKQKQERDKSLNVLKQKRSILDDANDANNVKEGESSSEDSFRKLEESEDRKRQQNEALVNQGKEITLLRQLLLKEQIKYRRIKEEDSERLRAALSRIASLEQSIRIHRDDGTMKLRELETALRVVSGRSDLHSSLAATRQELASERVASVHTKGELELHVKLLEDEKERVADIRGKLVSTQDELDSLKIISTLEGIEGIDPLTILEKFATTAVDQEREIGRLKRRLQSGGTNANDDNDFAANKENEADSTNVDRNLEKLKVDRLVARNRELESELEILHSKNHTNKERDLENNRNSEMVHRESTQKFKRINSKLNRRLISSEAECEELRTKIELLQNKDIENDESLRLANSELERTKQKLVLQSNLAAKAASLHGDNSMKPAIHSEVARLQSLLDERTSQVTVLLQSIESLQSASAVINSVKPKNDNDNSDSASESMETTNNDTNTTNTINNDSSASVSISIPDDDSIFNDNVMMNTHKNNGNNASANWALQNISKRVVSLTAELSSSMAVAAMMERRAERLTREVEQRNKLTSFLECKLNLYESEHKKHEMRAQTMADEHCRLSAMHQKEQARVSTENNILRRNLRECEVKLSEAEVEQAALSGDCQVLEENLQNVRSKLKSTSLRSNRDGGGIASIGGGASETAIVISTTNGDEVVSDDKKYNNNLVQQFIDQLSAMRSHYPNGHRTRVQEDQIFEFVSDVVKKTDAECVYQTSKRRALENTLRSTLIEKDNLSLTNYELSTQHERMSKRLEMAEEALSDKQATKWKHTENTIALLERRISSMQEELISLAEKDLYICAEHRTNAEQLEKIRQELHEEKRKTYMLQSEFKVVNGKARANANRDVHAMIEDNEAKLKRWFENELPLLCSKANTSGKNMWSSFDEDAVEEANATAALAQALTVSKVVQGKLEMKLSGALERCDSANSDAAELKQVVSRLQDEIKSMESVAGTYKVEGGMSRLWELYAPTGNLIESSKVTSGEPNPTMQNLLQEVDDLRSSTQKAQQDFKASESERKRLEMWLKEARVDAEAAQDQLSRRVTAIRGELEARHGREITDVVQRNSEEQTKQAEIIGTLREELVVKEGQLQEAKLRLQLFGNSGDSGSGDAGVGADGNYNGDNHDVIQNDALLQERSFLLSKTEKLTTMLKETTAEKISLEQECERLVSSTSNTRSDLEAAQQELSIHRSAIRALEESITAALTETSSLQSTDGEKVISTPILARSLASSKLAESKALHQLKKASTNEMKLRLKVEDLERHTKELNRLAVGLGSGEGPDLGTDLESKSLARDLISEHEKAASPWINESLAKLRERVATQASAIAYLELRIAQFLAEQSDKPGDSNIQNLKRELTHMREEKENLTAELEGVREEMRERNSLALNALDVNSTRIEAESEMETLRGVADAWREKDSETNERLGSERKKRIEESEKSGLVRRELGEREQELAAMKARVEELAESKKILMGELKICREKLLERGAGGKLGVYLHEFENIDCKIDLEKLKDKPLFVACSELYEKLSSWLEEVGEGNTWQTLWSLTQMANSCRELAATVEELPLGLASEMEKLKERFAALQSEMEDGKNFEEKAAEVAEAVARSQSVEAIQALRAQVLHLKKKAEEGEEHRKEMAAEGEILRRETEKAREEGERIRQEMLKKGAVSEEEIASMRTELVKLRKTNWETTSSLRKKYDSALGEMEKSTNKYSETAAVEIARLEGLLQEANDKLRSVQQVGFVFNEEGDNKSNKNNKTKAKESYNKNVFDLETEVSTLRAQLDSANESASSMAKKFRESTDELAALELSHSEQVGILRGQFGRYREAQEKLVKGLNGQVRQLKEGGGGKQPFSRTRVRGNRVTVGGGLDRRGGGTLPTAALTLEEKIKKQQLRSVGSAEIEELMSLLAQREAQLNTAEGKLKNLMYEYKMKVEEAEAATRAGYEGGIVGGVGESDEVVVRVVDNAILEAKHAVATQEISLLREELRASADAASEMRREVAVRVLQTAQARRSNTSPKVESLLRQLGEAKKLANSEITRLKTQIATMKESKSNADDVLAMKKKIANMHSALALSKEDLSRKTKIVMNLRSSRAQDEKAVEQWKSEVAGLEQKLGKCTRELSRKEGLLKECKNKLEALGGGTGEGVEKGEKENENGNGNNDSGASPNLDKDVEGKMRGMSLERTRMRQQVAVLKSKIDAQNEEISRLEAEADKLKSAESKMTLLKQSIARKDSILKGVKAQLEATAKEFVDYKARSEVALKEAERKIRGLAVKVKDEKDERSSGEERELARVAALEESRANLNEELQGIKSSLYNILGDLYDANVKARENIAVANKGGSDNESGDFSLGLDQASVDKIGGMLDLTPTEIADIFSADGRGGGSEGASGVREGVLEKSAFLNQVNEALGGGGGAVTELAHSMIADNLNIIQSVSPPLSGVGGSRVDPKVKSGGVEETSEELGKRIENFASGLRLAMGKKE